MTELLNLNCHPFFAPLSHYCSLIEARIQLWCKFQGKNAVGSNLTSIVGSWKKRKREKGKKKQ